MTSWDTNQVLTSMIHEWKLIVAQGMIPAVALTALCCVNTEWEWFTILRVPCKLYAIYKMCLAPDPPPSGQALLVPARILANVIAYIVLTMISMSILHVKADFDGYQKDRYGIMCGAAVEFFGALSLYNSFRGLFMFVDNYLTPGNLSKIFIDSSENDQ